MKDLRTIDLGVHGFTLNVCSNGSGACVSDLHDENASPDWNASVNALESLVLAHALAGVDVEEPAYLEGLETAVEAISQDIGDRGGCPNCDSTGRASCPLCNGTNHPFPL